MDKAGHAAYAIIPCLSLAGDPERSHAFILVFDARKHTMFMAQYPLESFTDGRRQFSVTIGGSRFGLDGLQLDLVDGATTVRAELRFSGIKPWPVRLLSPGVMGWYAFVPGMECYHGVLSLNHTIEGYVDVGGDRVDMGGGRGYIEKDWGRSMPSSWIWMQTNHFDGEGDVSLTGSIARIPWLGRSFTGFIFGLYLRGRLYQFTTYGRARVNRIDVTEGRVDIALESRTHRLAITAERAPGVALPAPLLGEMTARVNESLSSVIRVDLYQKNGTGDQLLFSGAGRNAGLEVTGDPRELARGLRNQAKSATARLV